MDNTEFVLSNLDAAIDSAKSIDLGDAIISLILGLLTALLALGTILPPSILGFIRVLLLVAAGATVFFLYWVIQRLIRHRRLRLKVLRKWQQESFFARSNINSFEQTRIRKMLDLIQSVEDTKTLEKTRYIQLDAEFMNLLK